MVLKCSTIHSQQEHGEAKLTGHGKVSVVPQVLLNLRLVRKSPGVNCINSKCEKFCGFFGWLVWVFLFVLVFLILCDIWFINIDLCSWTHNVRMWNIVTYLLSIFLIISKANINHFIKKTSWKYDQVAFVKEDAQLCKLRVYISLGGIAMSVTLHLHKIFLGNRSEERYEANHSSKESMCV